ncbi:hypothetical protein A0U92_11390 [Acetobacter aceti]|uniref:Uncharacterized protein n=1 Tax=Acetobacter aceti TaxID=435 RepID=A0A1U9KHM1_ACEAC|nr:hypothetical protein A0U92_11390 [Acetobacter aceti]
MVESANSLTGTELTERRADTEPVTRFFHYVKKTMISNVYNHTIKLLFGGLYIQDIDGIENRWSEEA